MTVLGGGIGGDDKGNGGWIAAGDGSPMIGLQALTLSRVFVAQKKKKQI